MDENKPKSIKEKFESFKKKKKEEVKEEVNEFVEAHKEEAEKEGYYYSMSKDSYELIPTFCVCELLINGISVNEINSVYRLDIINDKLYHSAGVAIELCDQELAYNVLCDISKKSGDFYNTLQTVFKVNSLPEAPGASKHAISSFTKGEDYNKTSFVSFGAKYEEILGSFEFDIPHYHVTATFFTLMDSTFRKLTEKMVCNGKYVTLQKTWNEKTIYRD